MLLILIIVLLVQLGIYFLIKGYKKATPEQTKSIKENVEKER